MSQKKKRRKKTAKQTNVHFTVAMAEAAQRESQLHILLTRRGREIAELEKKLDEERSRLNGFQLELQLRHYEIPILVAQIEKLKTVVSPTSEAMQVIRHMTDTLRSLLAWTEQQKPTMDPASWLLLNRKLGFAGNKVRRVPARRSA